MNERSGAERGCKVRVAGCWDSWMWGAALLVRPDGGCYYGGVPRYGVGCCWGAQMWGPIMGGSQVWGRALLGCPDGGFYYGGCPNAALLVCPDMGCNYGRCPNTRGCFCWCAQMWGITMGGCLVMGQGVIGVPRCGILLWGVSKYEVLPCWGAQM